jgi:mRNA-degrading endonuclease toxin of MazEF toxin-antitoxin module
MGLFQKIFNRLKRIIEEVLYYAGGPPEIFVPVSPVYREGARRGLVLTPKVWQPDVPTALFVPVSPVYREGARRGLVLTPKVWQPDVPTAPGPPLGGRTHDSMADSPGENVANTSFNGDIHQHNPSERTRRM